MLNTTKQMPRACYKGELQKFLIKFNEHTVRNDTNEVVAKNRNISIDEAKAIKVLYKNEVAEILEQYGEL